MSHMSEEHLLAGPVLSIVVPWHMWLQTGLLLLEHRSLQAVEAAASHPEFDANTTCPPPPPRCRATRHLRCPLLGLWKAVLGFHGAVLRAKLVINARYNNITTFIANWSATSH